MPLSLPHGGGADCGLSTAPTASSAIFTSISLQNIELFFLNRFKYSNKRGKSTLTQK